MVDIDILRRELDRTIVVTNRSDLGRKVFGKVRDSYISEGQRVMIATDRVSAFDVGVGTFPFRGEILNRLSNFWFEKTRDIAPNHFLYQLSPRATAVKDCAPIRAEFIVRNYMAGSLWKAYSKGRRTYAGHVLPDGMTQYQKFQTLMLTPSTKAPAGEHDLPISEHQLTHSGILTEPEWKRCKEICLDLFVAGSQWADSRGLILADTKYELGVDDDGHIIVIDELHTPDSSRYWYKDDYRKALEEGRPPHSLDKDVIRNWLEITPLLEDGKFPKLTDEIRIVAAEAYIDAYETLTGETFVPGERE